MKIKFHKITIDIIISIIICILSFPKFDPHFTTGLDSPYMWALNYLFSNDYGFLKHLVFPIGILGFLKHPIVGNNTALLSIIFFSIVKFSFSYFLIRLIDNHGNWLRVIKLFTILIASLFVTIDIAIIGTSVVSLLLFTKKNKFIYFIWAVTLTSLGLFIKPSIGISGIAVIITYIFLDFLKNRNPKLTIILITSVIISVLLLGMLLYQNITLLFGYFEGVIRMTEGYSSALALFPENNWWFLSIFIVTTICVPLFVKEINARFAYWLLIIPLFFMWKHAIIREDASHYSIIIYFIITFWTIILLTIEKLRFTFILLPIISISVLALNYKNTVNYSKFRIDFKGYKNFTDIFFNYQDVIHKSDVISNKNIKSNVLPDKIKSEIGVATIDIYPWDLSYIPANSLNWKPRTTLQSGAFSGWLDRKSSANFDLKVGPEFIIFQLLDDCNYGKLGSLDCRYILNDEPITIFTILNNYSIVDRNERFLLLKKDRVEKLSGPFNIGMDTICWNCWINTPKSEGAILRTKFYTNKNLIGKLKVFFYKDEELFIDYMLENNKVLSYRFVESNAKDGLWINPLIQNPINDILDPLVKKIRFRCSNSKFFKEKISICWEKIDLIEKNKTFSILKKSKKTYKIIKILSNNFEDEDSLKNNILHSSETVYSGKYANIVPSQGYSYTFTILLDSIWTQNISNLLIESEIMYNCKNIKDVVLVMSIENSGGHDSWESRKLNILNNEWNYAFMVKKINKNIHSKGLLKVYVYNPYKKKGEIYVDDFKIVFKEL